jgi:hypothetical protein
VLRVIGDRVTARRVATVLESVFPAGAVRILWPRVGGVGGAAELTESEVRGIVETGHREPSDAADRVEAALQGEPQLMIERRGTEFLIREPRRHPADGEEQAGQHPLASAAAWGSSVPGPYLTIRPGGRLNGRVTARANVSDGPVIVEAFWGPPFARMGIAVERAGRAEAEELAQAWASELAAGREPQAE